MNESAVLRCECGLDIASARESRYCMATREHSYSTGCGLWWTNVTLPSGWNIRPSGLDPNHCIKEGCHLIPKRHNDKAYIGPLCSVQRRNGKERDLLPYELERLKGIPIGYTRKETLYADRNQFSMGYECCTPIPTTSGQKSIRDPRAVQYY